MVILHLSDIHFGRDNPQYNVKGDFRNKKGILRDLLISIKDNTMKEWKEIQLEDGNAGWVPASVIEII